MGNDLILYRISIGVFYHKCYSVVKKRMLFFIKTFSLMTFIINSVIHVCKKCSNNCYKFAFQAFCTNVSFTLLLIVLILLGNDISENPGPTENEISIFHLNARSVRHKLDYIETVALDSSVICITESHLDESVSNKDV